MPNIEKMRKKRERNEYIIHPIIHFYQHELGKDRQKSTNNTAISSRQPQHR